MIFEQGLPVHLIGLDGTWSHDCLMQDVSESGAKLTLPQTPDEAAIKEFFLLLSMQGLVYRRCQLVWANGKQIGVNFIMPEERRKKVGRRSTDN